MSEIKEALNKPPKDKSSFIYFWMTQHIKHVVYPQWNIGPSTYSYSKATDAVMDLDGDQKKTKSVL